MMKKVLQSCILLFSVLTIHTNAAAVPSAACSDAEQCYFLPLIAGGNEGQQWQAVDGGLPDDWVRDIAIRPAPPHELLVAFRDEGIYRSRDDGQSWTRVYDRSTRQMAFAPTDPDVVYATVLNGLLRSDDGGATWQEAWPRDLGFGGWALAVDPADARHVYVGINAIAPYHVWETRDGGQSWSPSNLSLDEYEGIISLAVDPADSRIVFAGANTDVADHPQITRLYKTVDGGQSWRLVENGLPPSKRLTSINFDPCRPDGVVISRQKHGTVDRYLRRSDDGGATWQIAPLIDDDVGISPLPPCPIFADLHRSLDGGQTWQDISLDFPAQIPGDDEAIFTSWAPDPWRNVLWVGTRYHGLFSLSGVVPHSGIQSK